MAVVIATVEPSPQLHRFTRARYEKMVDAGIFDEDDRIELLDGEIVEMAPQKSRHATAVSLLNRCMADCFGRGFDVRVQWPLALGPHSEPEPYIAVVRGSPRDYRDAHPQHAELIVEVADATLAYDRGRKLAAYARAGIADYWILDLAASTLEVCRAPQGGEYADRQTLRAGDSIAPLSVRSASAIGVSDLLP